MYTHVLTRRHTRTHTYTHVHTRPHTYTHVHTRTHTYTHTHILSHLGTLMCISNMGKTKLKRTLKNFLSKTLKNIPKHICKYNARIKGNKPMNGMSKNNNDYNVFSLPLLL